MNGQPLVAVVTVNWNTARETLQCVESVLKSDYPNFFLIVVDNGSRKEERELLRSGLPKGVELLPLDKNYGYVGGVNRGLKQAKRIDPEYILVMNNDTVLDDAAINELVRASRRHENKCIVTGIVYDYHQPDIIQQTGSLSVSRRRFTFKPLYRNVQDPGLPGEDIVMDMIDDVFWLMHGNVFRSVGYYCESFWFNSEQADYALRAVKQGFSLVFTPRAKIWHKGSISIGGKTQNPIREYYDIKSKLILRSKHMERINFLSYYASTFLFLAKSCPKQMLKGLIRQDGSGKVLLARIMGFWDFNRWLLHKRPDPGEVPGLLKRFNR